VNLEPLVDGVAGCKRTSGCAGEEAYEGKTLGFRAGRGVGRLETLAWAFRGRFGENET
jgi:hypothetical protein